MKNHKAYTCNICKTEYLDSEEFRVVCPSCVALAMRKMTDDQYHQWLILNRSRIWHGLPLIAWDDNTIGDKDTYASWGMCSDDIAAFSDPETWAYGEMTKPHHWDKTRLRTISRGPDHYCPFDRRMVESHQRGFSQSGADFGCFYSCRIFGRQITKNDKDNAIAWFDVAIAALKENHET